MARTIAVLAPFAVVAAVGLPHLLIAQQPLTLEQALQEAHTANAELPLAAFGARIGQAQLREARRALGPRLSLDGDLHGGTPAAYAANDGRLQLLAEQPLYDGGALRAGIGVARAVAAASQAGYRVAEKDLDLEVRVDFATVLQLDTVIAVRRQGLARLRTYLDVIRARGAAGEGVAADLLKTQVQIGEAEAALADALRQRDLARLTLNDRLGRDPDAPLVLAALPAPVAPPDAVPEGWAGAPDVRRAEAESAAAQSAIGLVTAERRPHLSLEVDAGAQPAFGAFGNGINNGQGWGTEFLLSFSWPLFDAGAYRARRAQARLQADQTVAAAVAVRRQARLAWAAARAELAARYREVDARTRTAATALDSYLASESLYRGGATSALEVLDAYTSWIMATEAVAAAVFEYRIADAQSARWGAP
jgi:outer membrane protein TolC